MRQYLYLREDMEEVCVKKFTDIISNEEYDERDLIEVSDFVRPMEFFGISYNGKSYDAFCNVLDTNRNETRNIICCVWYP